MTINRDDALLKLAEWVWRLRREQSLHRAIDVVAERAEQVDGDDRRFLAHELAELLREAGRNAEAVQVLDRILERYPDEVRAAISKAHIYFSALDQPEQALKWIDAAMERAGRTGFSQREVLGDKARILLKLSRGDELSDVLEEIMSLQMAPGIPDIGRERDFVDRAPPGLIRKNVLERYNEFRPRRPGDSSTNEQPKYEPANDLM
jgi:tetratricopeptide (TPR) repeat protein